MKSAASGIGGNSAKKRIILLLGVIATVAFLTGGFMGVQELLFLQRAEKATGTYQDSFGGIDAATGKIAVTYLMKFTTKQGRRVESFQQVTGEPLEDKAAVPIYYDPQNPENARLERAGRWELPTRFLAMGALLGMFGAGIRFVPAKRPQPIQTV